MSEGRLFPCGRDGAHQGEADCEKGAVARYWTLHNPLPKTWWSQPEDRWGVGKKAKRRSGLFWKSKREAVGRWRRMVRGWVHGRISSLLASPLSNLWYLGDLAWRAMLQQVCPCYTLYFTWSTELKLDKWFPWICFCNMIKDNILSRAKLEENVITDRVRISTSDLAEATSSRSCLNLLP